MSLHVAVVQYAPTTDKAENIATIQKLVSSAADQGAQLAVLPEYATFTNRVFDRTFVDNAEELDGESVTALRKLSAAKNIALIAGLMNQPVPERSLIPWSVFTAVKLLQAIEKCISITPVATTNRNRSHPVKLILQSSWTSADCRLACKPATICASQRFLGYCSMRVEMYWHCQLPGCPGRLRSFTGRP